MKASWFLTGGPCAGWYEAESSWPPPETIRAVYDGNGYSAVLDLPEDDVCLGEKVAEYELASYGFVCGRGRGKQLSGPVGHYFPAGWTVERRMRAARVDESGLHLVGS